MKRGAQMSKTVGTSHTENWGRNAITTAHLCLFKIVAGVLAGHPDVFAILV
jgi:hypothetical protein